MVTIYIHFVVYDDKNQLKKPVCKRFEINALHFKMGVFDPTLPA